MATVSDSFLMLHHQAHSLAMILIRACQNSLNRVIGLRVCFVFVCLFVCLLHATLCLQVELLSNRPLEKRQFFSEITELIPKTDGLSPGQQRF